MSKLYNLEKAAEIAKEPREIVEIIAANTDNMTEGEWHHIQGKDGSTLVVTELGAKQVGDLIRELASIPGQLESELRGYADSVNIFPALKDEDFPSGRSGIEPLRLESS